MLVCFVRVQYMNINQERFLTKLIANCMLIRIQLYQRLRILIRT